LVVAVSAECLSPKLKGDILATIELYNHALDERLDHLERYATGRKEGAIKRVHDMIRLNKELHDTVEALPECE
jgi:hypothetical protein